MKLFITDSEKNYRNSGEEYKILVEVSLIMQCSFMSPEQVAAFNLENNNIETIAGEKMLKELYALCGKLKNVPIKTNKFIAALPTAIEKAFALLYPVFSTVMLEKHQLALLLDKIFNAVTGEIKAVETDLRCGDISYSEFLFSPSYRTVEFISRPKNKKAATDSFKDLFFYTPYYVSRKAAAPLKFPSVKKKRHLLLLIYNVDHHFRLLHEFFRIVKQQDGVHLSIVIFETGDKSVKTDFSKKYGHDNIRIYHFTEFRKPLFRDTTKQILHDLSGFIPPSELDFLGSTLKETELKYQWMQNIFSSLKPDACFHLTTHEIGRILANVANYNKVPSVQADYALFADWYVLESHIRFTARACINQAIIDAWKRRKDPTPFHHAIGFCALDELKSPVMSKKEFMEKNGLDEKHPTLLFAGTWSLAGGSYEEEQQMIISMLSGICHRNKLNLIIKKHPLDKDKSAAEILRKNNYNNQKVFEHRDLAISDAIYYSDFVTNQMSSIVLECLYFERPFCYITTNEHSNQTQTSLLKNEKFASTVPTSKLEQFISELMQGNGLKDLSGQMKARKEHFLYRTDGKASQRLFDLLTSIRYSQA